MSRGLEKPLATGTSSTCRVGGGGGGGGGVVEPPLQPQQASPTHKPRRPTIGNVAVRFCCMVPPRPGLHSAESNHPASSDSRLRFVRESRWVGFKKRSVAK